MQQPESTALFGHTLMREGSRVLVHSVIGAAAVGELYATTALGITVLLDDGTDSFYPWGLVVRVDIAETTPKQRFFAKLRAIANRYLQLNI